MSFFKVRGLSTSELQARPWGLLSARAGATAKFCSWFLLAPTRQEEGVLYLGAGCFWTACFPRNFPWKFRGGKNKNKITLALEKSLQDIVRNLMWWSRNWSSVRHLNTTKGCALLFCAELQLQLTAKTIRYRYIYESDPYTSGTGGSLSTTPPSHCCPKLWLNTCVGGRSRQGKRRLS